MSKRPIRAITAILSVGLAVATGVYAQPAYTPADLEEQGRSLRAICAGCYGNDGNALAGAPLPIGAKGAAGSGGAARGGAAAAGAPAAASGRGAAPANTPPAVTPPLPPPALPAQAAAPTPQRLQQLQRALLDPNLR